MVESCQNDEDGDDDKNHNLGMDNDRLVHDEGYLLHDNCYFFQTSFS